MTALLAEYYADILSRLAQLGGPAIPPEAPIADFWDHIDDFLPPRGRLCLGVGTGGTWLGCGTLSRLPGDRGELKRLYVRPAGRGTGLGRALVTARIEAAREMGLKALLVDTLSNTAEMQGLSGSLGFTPTERYAESATANAFPEMRPYMRYFRLDL
ncbi:GNAT family N-acetyltransferase [Ponticoccus alexandrii]|uniref:GNAT family N-acetyltransferase n=2 Tax=Ponticoccus alexandrii TaxID=1943633 RepID=A0ABX7FE73_9RHOB|nr:GNAT family N-acetyltransferase [Ponticoccus alexandrii]